MATFRMIESNNAGIENYYKDFHNYEDCKKAFRKTVRDWKKFAEKGARIQTEFKEHSPFCCSLYQEGEIQLTWEMTVIPEKKI